MRLLHDYELVAVRARLDTMWDPILTATGAPISGSVAELIRVPVCGHNQAMMIRGTSTTNPVLLFLGGGPMC
jgi:hypothetical protein